MESWRIKKVAIPSKGLISKLEETIVGIEVKSHKLSHPGQSKGNVRNHEQWIWDLRDTDEKQLYN